MKKILLPLLFCATLSAGARQYWALDPDGNAIEWKVDSSSYGHTDHIEMAGKQIATVLRYGINNDGSFGIDKSLVFPMLRTIPNDTHASFQRRVTHDIVKDLAIGRNPMKEKVKSIRIADGCLEVESHLNGNRMGELQLIRRYFPSTDNRGFIELYTAKNIGNNAVELEIPSIDMRLTTNAAEGIDAPFTVHVTSAGKGGVALAPGESVDFSVINTATKKGETPFGFNASEEYDKRKDFATRLAGSLKLKTPNDTLNRLMDFAKLRVCESIYATKGGPLQGPGGESYYAAIWANDQAEYANPFFPFTGYDYANESAENSFNHFARFMNDEGKPIPSSIIAEGDSYWTGAGDRGDAAMIAYGASRYALANGNRETALHLLPLIEWCLQFSRNKINADGVVNSDSDELEGRFPSGEANLCTNSLYYDALLSTAYLLEDLGLDKSKARNYKKQAAELRKNMEAYFAGPVEGFDTYAYYKGNDILRAWICIPLTMGIFDRTDATVDALFSPRLWTGNGLLTQAGEKTFWDRSTLYALRGVFQAGCADRALPYLESYTSTRLLGDHVPYPVEAWPEGSQRHLSTESALYARIFTEGLFGIRPTGLRSFELTLSIPSSWNDMSLSSIKAFGSDFSIIVHRVSANRINVKITTSDGRKLLDRTISEGKTLKVRI
ncbi:MAG: hypothetical protein OSJ34_01645 [Muribaculaceae bacterium]|jgi:hypothetical protein|nr:hypothetical protein [Muribaculaceae bacterium]